MNRASCGHENRPGAKFCVECGAALARCCTSCHCFAAQTHYRSGDADRAFASARQAEAISRALETSGLAALVQLALGYSHLAAGRAAGAAGVAEALLQAGDLSAAESLAEEAIVLCCRSLRAVCEAIAHSVLARLLLRRDGAAARDTGVSA